MIKTYRNLYRDYELLPAGFRQFPGANAVTVIVGKNGAGESRLLNGVVAEVLSNSLDRDLFEREERFGRLSPNSSAIEFFWRPRKIICVSTSPFDKFPLLKRSASSQIYSYLGLRGLPSANLSTAYMSRIVASLIRAIKSYPARSHVVSEVLHYLGYQEGMRCIFSVGLPSRLQEEVLYAPDPVAAIANLRPMPLISHDGANIIRQLRESDPFDVLAATEFLREFKRSGRKPRINLYLDKNGVHLEEDDVDGVLALVRTGLARLKEVSLKKGGSGFETERVLLSEASSGEQSVVMSLLGIASQIEDGSLVCIDEPEVCLHPEWQERYVHLLLETFSKLKDCQFLIATHSPQIVAELPVGNCYVMNMADGMAHDTKYLSRRSIDFQLASVFGTPGHQNEYLNRLAVGLFSRVAKKKQFAPKDEQTLNLLREILPKLSVTDPVAELIKALIEMKGVYG